MTVDVAALLDRGSWSGYQKRVTLLANAFQVSMYALAARVYPTSVRATGVAYVGTIGRFGGLLASLFGAALIQAGGGAFFGTLAIAMVCAFAGLAWLRSHYPALAKRAS